MKPGLILSLIFLAASLTAAPAHAGFEVQCHKGSSGGVDGVKPNYDGNERREPDGLRPGFGGGAGPDQVTPKFDNQSVAHAQNLTPEERKARREARRKAIREKIAAMKAKIQAYIQANAGGNALQGASFQSLQTAFEDIKRGPASLSPATVTPSLNYETISTGGVSGAR